MVYLKKAVSLTIVMLCCRLPGQHSFPVFWRLSVVTKRCHFQWNCLKSRMWCTVMTRKVNSKLWRFIAISFLFRAPWKHFTQMQEALLLFLRVSTGSGIILWKTVNCITTVHKYLVSLYPSLTAPQGTPPSPVWIHIDSCLNTTNVSFRCWSSESSPFLCRELQQDPGIWGEWKKSI